MTQLVRAMCLFLLAVASGVTPAAARVTVESAKGSPFGVAKVTINPIDGNAMKLVLNNGFGFDDPDGRILYPVFVPGKFAQFLNNVLKPEDSIPPSSITIYFLFRGDDPFSASALTPRKDTFRVTPTDRPPRLHARLLEEWWKEYRTTLRSHEEEGAYPKNIDAYLEASLASRMQLPLDPVSEKKKRDGSPPSSLHLLVGSEQAKADLIHGAFGREASSEIRIAEMPAPISFPEPTIPPMEREVAIEPIALRAPKECFYVHFGRFNHFLWLSDLLQDYGGDIGRMAVLRGQSKSMNEQIERRLGVKQNALAKLLGESVVNDIAIIGRDAFFDEGPAIGVLIHAKNNLLLTTDLGRQRSEALARETPRGAKSEKIRILDRDASLMSTPDQAFRSIMVSDGDFHLVTTSLEIANRFLETRDGGTSLGQTPEFLATRAQFPTDRKDTVFAYFSTYFFQGLLTPKYQLEQRRRLTSLVEMEMLTLARMAAEAEGIAASSADDLVAAGLLPRDFGQRADGSTITETPEGFSDSLRGARGSFLPITDVPMTAVSMDEAAAYEKLASDWRGRQLDPLVVAIRHEPLDGVERLHVDARAALLDRQKYKVILDSFGPPTTTAITRPADDIVHVQAVLTGNPIVKSSDVSHLVLGVKDMPPLEKLRPEGLLRTLDFIRSTPGYLAAWPRAGLLALLPIRLGPESTADGIQRLLFGVYRLRSGDLTAFSFDHRLLETLPGQIVPVETDRPAQVRVEVADLTKTQLSGWINAISFERARQTSTANVKAVHWVSQQFKTPRGVCFPAFEKYVGAKLVCVLGGEYTLVTTPSGLEYWESSEAAIANETERPADYQAPFLVWFRGLRLEGNIEETQVQLHGFVDLMRKDSKKPTAASNGSLWDLLNGAPKTQKAAEEIPPPLPTAPAEEVAPPAAPKKRAF